MNFQKNERQAKRILAEQRALRKKARVHGEEQLTSKERARLNQHFYLDNFDEVETNEDVRDHVWTEN